jgi:hypothetical protein
MEIRNIVPIDPRETRRHKLNAWLSGKITSRWSNDDGRILHLDEYAFWPDHIKQAEQTFFAVIDAEYEIDK